MRKLKKRSFIQQAGFTLIEVVIAIAIIGGLALVTMQLMNVQVGLQEASEINEDMVTLSSQILSVLNDQESCTRNLSGEAIDPTEKISADIAQISTANGQVIIQAGQDYANSDISINRIFIDANVDDPFLASSVFHLYRAELVLDISRNPEVNTTPGAIRIIKRFPLLLDYSIHQAYSMYTTKGVSQNYVKEKLLETCKSEFDETTNRFIGHDVYKVFCSDEPSDPQVNCIGVCQVKNIDEIMVTRCL